MDNEVQLSMDLRHIIWDEALWSRFVKRLKWKVSISESEEMGVLHIKNLQKRTSFETQVLVKGLLSEFLDKYRPLQVLISDMGTGEVELPLVQNTDSDTYLFYSTRLAMLQTDERAAKHVLQYFLDLRLFYNPCYSNFLFFEEDLEKLLHLHYKSYLAVEQEGSIIDFVRKELREGMYVNVHLDEFYVVEKDYYDKRHFVHENLIYGYDDEKQSFRAFGITKRQQTAGFEIPYEQFLVAYEKGKLFYFCGAEYLEQEGYYPVIVYQIRGLGTYEFTEDIFIEKITAFLYPPAEEMVENDVHVYGRNIYDWLLQDLSGESDRGIVDFRVLHLLYEHKKCIKNRLEYLSQKGQLSDACQYICDNMQTVIDDFQEIRLLYLKQLRKEGKLESMNKVIEDSEMKDTVAELLRESMEKEKHILSAVMEKMIQEETHGVQE